MDEFFKDDLNKKEEVPKADTNDYTSEQAPKQNQNEPINGEYHFVPNKNQYYTPPKKETGSSQPYQNYQNNYNQNQNTQNYGTYNRGQSQNYGQYNAQQNPYQQNYNSNYYTPPQYSQNGEKKKAKKKAKTVVNGVAVDETAPKKKNKTAIILIIIFAVCIVVAIAGISAAYLGVNNKADDSTSQTQSVDDDSASAKVEKSSSAATKDKDGNLTAAGVAEKAIDSCVGITVYTKQDAYSYFYNYGQGSGDNGSNEAASGEGSGVFMSESNGKTYIMTAAHVIADGSSFKITTNNGKEYDATMVGYDSQTDIGVLSVDKTGFQIASFGDSDDIVLGEQCIAIGCPGGLEFINSITQGIVSALSRPVKSSIGYNNECIQVDAAINPGNSGGALFNMQGQVIGINSSKIAATEYEGMGFAVPSNTAVQTANAIIKDGYVAGRAKLGIKYNTLQNFNNADAILSALAQKGFKDAQGTMVIQSIDDSSDLKNKDVQQYDMIVAANGKTLTSTDIMTSLLSESKAGDTITLTIARVDGNKIKTFEVKCKLIESKE